MSSFSYTTVAATIVSLLTAIDKCAKHGNVEWSEKHATRLAYVCAEYLPSGSGIDGGTRLNREKSNESRLVLKTSFHHMNENGCYDGWSDHTITITPAFDGINVKISGKNRNDIKDYLHEVYYHAMQENVDSDRIDRRPAPRVRFIDLAEGE